MGKKLTCRKSFLTQFLEVRAEMQELDWALASGSSELLCPLQPLSSSHLLSCLMHLFLSRCLSSALALRALSLLKSLCGLQKENNNN